MDELLKVLVETVNRYSKLFTETMVTEAEAIKALDVRLRTLEYILVKSRFPNADIDIDGRGMKEFSEQVKQYTEWLNKT